MKAGRKSRSKCNDSLCCAGPFMLRTTGAPPWGSVTVLPVLACLFVFTSLTVTSGQQAETSAAGFDLSTVSPARMAPLPDIASLTSAQYCGAVSMAMAGMRLVYGDMTHEEEAKFEAKWQPLFAHPSEEVITYLNTLNPLLMEFIAVRTALNDATEAFDAAQLEVAAAAATGDPDAVEGAIDSAQRYVVMMKSLSARMNDLTEQILALGDPPDAAGLRARARQQHEEAFETLEASPDMLAILPPELAAVPAVSYPFKAVVRVPDKPEEELQLNWAFSDGRTLRTPVSQEVQHKFYLDPAKPKSSLNVDLIDTTTNKVLSRVTVPIEVRLPQGQWVLIDRQVQTDAGAPGVRFRGGRLNPDTGQNEPIPMEPENIFDGAVQVQDLSADVSYANLTKTYEAALRLNWGKPPLRLNPTEKFNFEIEARGVNCTLVYDPPYAAIAAILDFYPWGPSLRTQEQSLGQVRAEAKLSTTQEPVDPTQQLQRKSQEFTAPRPYVRGPKGEAIAPTGQYLTLTITGSARFARCSPTFRVTYRYDWDSTGKRAALAEQGIAQADDDDKEEEDEPARAERVRREQIEFHRENIAYFRRNQESLEARLSQTTDATTRNDLTRDLLYQRDAMQRERDQIKAIETGEYVRTPTELDALNQQIMAEHSRKMAEDWGDIRRAIDRIDRVIEQADPSDRDRLRDFFFRQVNSDTISRCDVDDVRRVTKAIGDQVIGKLEAEAAVEEEAAVAASERLQDVQNIKAGADVSMMALSFVGGSSVYMTYQGATGYIEGGLGEAFKRTVGGYNTATTIAQTAIDGYQRAVLDHLERYAADPQNVRLDEQQAGFEGAMWSAGKAAAMAAAMKFAGYVLSSGQCPPGTRPTLDAQRQQAQLRAFRMRQAEGQLKVQLFQQRARTLAAAGRAGASRDNIRKLRVDMEGAYRDIKTDYFAKLHLNAVGRAGDTKTLHCYNSCDRSHMRKVVQALDRRMTDAGFSKQQYKSFSNSASKGKAGMDVDLGAVEPPRYVLQGGQKVTNPAHVEWRRSLTQKQPDGTLRRVGPQEFQEAGQRHLEEAFAEVYGRKPGEAMTAFTTSYHPEAYRDIKWLGKKGMKTALVHETDPKWTQQAADVTGFKVNHLPKEHPQLGYYGHLQEQCRGMVKDFDTKLGPMFEFSKNPEAVKHMKSLRNVMNRFALNEIGPIEAEQQLRILTGGEGIKGVQDRFAVMLRGLRSLTPSSAP